MKPNSVITKKLNNIVNIISMAGKRHAQAYFSCNVCSISAGHEKSRFLLKKIQDF
jgi:hypothetical protein